MTGCKYFTCFVGVIFCHVLGVLTKSCSKDDRRTGYIDNRISDTGLLISADDFSDEVCKNIHVPPNRFIRLKIIELHFYGLECSSAKLEIQVTESKETYSFCSRDTIKNPIIAVADIQVNFIYTPYRWDTFSHPHFKLHFEIKDIECLRNNSFRCSDFACISRSEVCNGVKDCENGTDEVGCETGILSIKGVADARAKEVTWIESKRTSSWGWHENTPRVLTSLFLAGAVTFNGTSFEEQLMAKQTELKTSIALLKNPLSNEQLSMFINSLLVTCHNPRQFYGQNLIKRLRKQMQSADNFTHPLTYLTLCNANESRPMKASEDLNKILTTDADYPFVKDFQAIAVMALSCYENQAKFLTEADQISLKMNYDNIIKLLKGSQLPDGSFGNLHTTALITQALISSGQEHEMDWKLNATIHYLLQQLQSPHDIVASSLALPVLNAKSLSDVSKINCTTNPKRNGYDNDASEINDYIGPKIRVQYSLFVGDQKDVIHTISLRVPENFTAYEVMKMAESEDSKFSLKFKKISGVMYVYQIGEVFNDPEGGFFWLLYQGLESTNATLTHYNFSPDQLVMQDDEHLVMWYKTARL